MEINTELITKARTAKSPEELLAMAKENGIELTEETAGMYFDQLHPKTGELDDDELDNVAGGGCYSQGGRLKTTSGYRCKHFSQGQSSVGLKGTCAQCSYWGRSESHQRFSVEFDFRSDHESDRGLSAARVLPSEELQRIGKQQVM